MAEYISEIVMFVLGLLGGYGLKVTIDKRKITRSSDTQSDQSGSKVGGDQAGRDINKNMK